MICCAILAALAALIWWPLRSFRRSTSGPLAWRPHASAPPATPRPPFTLRARLRSFGHACDGLRFLVRSEHNARLHLAASALVVGAGFAFRISLDDWRWMILAIGLVWSAEAFNTAVEQVCDLVSPRTNAHVKAAKDVAAGAVLVSAAVAAAIGMTTFLPYLRIAATPTLEGAICKPAEVRSTSASPERLTPSPPRRL